MFGVKLIAFVLGVLFAGAIVTEQPYSQRAKIFSTLIAVYLAFNAFIINHDNWQSCILFTIIPIIILIAILFLEDENQLSKKGG